MGHHDHATHETGNSDLYTKQSVTWRTHKSNSAQVEFELYFDKVTASNDILAFWRGNNKMFPRLATLASSIFCAPATTAGVERFFSVAGHILGFEEQGFLMKTMRVCYLQKLISICMILNILLVTSA